MQIFLLSSFFLSSSLYLLSWLALHFTSLFSSLYSSQINDFHTKNVVIIISQTESNVWKMCYTSCISSHFILNPISMPRRVSKRWRVSLCFTQNINRYEIEWEEESEIVSHGKLCPRLRSSILYLHSTIHNIFHCIWDERVREVKWKKYTEFSEFHFVVASTFIFVTKTKNILMTMSWKWNLSTSSDRRLLWLSLSISTTINSILFNRMNFFFLACWQFGNWFLEIGKLIFRMFSFGYWHKFPLHPHFTVMNFISI